MKVLFYINAIHHGGAERVMVNLANMLSFDSRNSVVLVTSFKDEWEYNVYELVKRINLVENMPSGFIKRNTDLCKRLRRVLKDENPDTIVSFMAEPNFRLLISSWGIKAKTIISIRNDPNREYPNRLFKFLAKTLYRRADRVVFQTSEAQAWFPLKIQSKSEIIMNQVDEKFYGMERDESPRDIITTGRLVSQKNHEMLIRAFALISDNIKENLIIYGEGDLREHLQSLISELNLENRVFLPGATTDVLKVLKSAKLFVLSSDYEGMPNSLMEALAVGVPSISTDCPCGGPRELISHGVNGFLVPVNDIDAMAKMMQHLLDIPEEQLKAVSENALKKANEFKPDVIFEEWKKIIL